MILTWVMVETEGEFGIMGRGEGGFAERRWQYV